MNNKNNLYSLLLSSVAVVLFLNLISSTALASISETRITTNPSNSENSIIYGNTVVWQDDRNGNWDIYIEDLSNKKQIHTTDKSDQTDPAIYGKKVVWTDDRNKCSDVYGCSDIYLQDLSTNKQTRITTSGKASMPNIYENKITYVKLGYNERQNWNDLYIYDLSTKKETQLPTVVSAHNPAIYGNRIVWLDFDGFSGGDYNIYMYDLINKKQAQITKGDFYKGEAINMPEIYGNRIVYDTYRNENWDIYMYDLSTKKETRITTNKSDQQAPAIYGNTIVWQDNRNGNWDIYAYDLVTHQQIHTTDKSDQVAPAIYSNKVVWTDYRNGKTDIYIGTISYLPVAAFSASATSGKKSLTVKFNDESTDAYYWSWNFGDGTTSKDQNPVHKYTKAGKYSVTLTVKNAAGINTAKKTNYIAVK